MQKKSVTLIELVMVILVVGTLAAGFSWYLIQVIDVWNFVSFRNETVNQARSGLMRMSRDIRQIIPLGIEQAGIDALQFLVIDENDYSVRLRYRLDGSNLFYEIDDIPQGAPDGTFDSSNVLLGGVSSLNFTYFDINDNPTSLLEFIHFINISLTVQERTQQASMSLRVFPRNFR